MRQVTENPHGQLQQRGLVPVLLPQRFFRCSKFLKLGSVPSTLRPNSRLLTHELMTLLTGCSREQIPVVSSDELVLPIFPLRTSNKDWWLGYEDRDGALLYSYAWVPFFLWRGIDAVHFSSTARWDIFFERLKMLHEVTEEGAMTMVGSALLGTKEQGWPILPRIFLRGCEYWLRNPEPWTR